jgi:4-alpha-glucanotransferase
MQMTDNLEKRRAGVLLHITSLPGSGSQGDLGQNAYNFVDFLKSAGITIWQTLPLGVTHADGSPYQCLSAHAGNPELINIEQLVSKGWLLDTEQCEECWESKACIKRCLLKKAFQGFMDRAGQHEKDDFARFSHEQAFWLDDFALFMALRAKFNEQCWNQWSDQLKERDASTLKEARSCLVNQIARIKFEQYVFFQQWRALKKYANERGILMFGDIPIFVSYDSVDVWANREVFKLDESGEMLVVAGVPPDYFSETGQRWGNPHYNWEFLRKTGFYWWLERLKTQLGLFDILRIDHFRGLEAAWEIPATEPTAQNGEWIKAPGKALLKALKVEFGSIPLVAEDLGVITPEVDALRDKFNLPGMKILQFAFGGGSDNPYLPVNYNENCVVYTGTHDNDTTVGWVEKLTENERSYISEYLGFPTVSLNNALIQAALASVANLAIIPMQDILELDSASRMNMPGTIEGNWKWRFDWEQLTPERVNRLAHLIKLFNRF